MAAPRTPPTRWIVRTILLLGILVTHGISALCVSRFAPTVGLQGLGHPWSLSEVILVLALDLLLLLWAWLRPRAGVLVRLLRASTPETRQSRSLEPSPLEAALVSVLDLVAVGLLVTWLRPRATAGAVTLDEFQAPAFAFVHRGLGRTAAFTGQVGGSFGAAGASSAGAGAAFPSRCTRANRSRAAAAHCSKRSRPRGTTISWAQPPLASEIPSELRSQ